MGGSPGITHLVAWRHRVYSLMLEIISSSWGVQMVRKHDPKQEGGLCSNSCYDT